MRSSLSFHVVFRVYLQPALHLQDKSIKTNSFLKHLRGSISLSLPKGADFSNAKPSSEMRAVRCAGIQGRAWLLGRCMSKNKQVSGLEGISRWAAQPPAELGIAFRNRGLSV